MKHLLLPFGLICTLILSSAAYGQTIVVDGQKFLVGPPVFNAEGVDIDPPGGSDTDVNNVTEGRSIYDSWVAAGRPAGGSITGINTWTIGGTSGAIPATVSEIDFGGSGHEFATTNPYPNGCCGGDDFIVHASGVALIRAGTYTLHAEGDDGSSVIFNTLAGDDVVFSKYYGGSSGTPASNELLFEGPTGNSNNSGVFTLTQDSLFAVDALFFERGGGDYWEVTIASGDQDGLGDPSGNTAFEIFGDGALNDSVQFFQTALAVPEPASIAVWTIIGSVLVGFGYYRCRRKK